MLCFHIHIPSPLKVSLAPTVFLSSFLSFCLIHEQRAECASWNITDTRDLCLGIGPISDVFGEITESVFFKLHSGERSPENLNAAEKASAVVSFPTRDTFI